MEKCQFNGKIGILAAQIKNLSKYLAQEFAPLLILNSCFPF